VRIARAVTAEYTLYHEHISVFVSAKYCFVKIFVRNKLIHVLKWGGLYFDLFCECFDNSLATSETFQVIIRFYVDVYRVCPQKRWRPSYKRHVN
jgi:hypothetical protein